MSTTCTATHRTHACWTHLQAGALRARLRRLLGRHALAALASLAALTSSDNVRLHRTQTRTRVSPDPKHTRPSLAPPSARREPHHRPTLARLGPRCSIDFLPGGENDQMARPTNERSIRIKPRLVEVLSRVFPSLFENTARNLKGRQQNDTVGVLGGMYSASRSQRTRAPPSP